jgi:MEMO1 family protein
MTAYKNIRENVAAGSFYPAGPDALRKQINNFLENVEPAKISNIKSIICPHAGYIYSGQVTAHSYKNISGKKFDSIFIIAPSHSEYFNYISIFNGDAYSTPLGIASVDKNRAELLAGKSALIKLSQSGHLNEHSIEVQLPFLQALLDDIKIVPIVMGQQNRQNIEELGNIIGNLFKDEDILVIASTDLSHYHPYETAVSLDSKVKELVRRFDIKSMTADLLNGNIEMCGGGPVISAMIASKIMGANSSKVLEYKNSGDVTGDKSAVVGYLSAVFYKK